MKQSLEQESTELSAAVQSLTKAKQEAEQKQKKVEGQLAELQAHFSDSERQKGELGEQLSKVMVSKPSGSTHTASETSCVIHFDQRLTRSVTTIRKQLMAGL